MLISLEISDKLVAKFKENYEKLTMLPVTDELSLVESISALATDAVVEKVFDFLDEDIMENQENAFHTSICLASEVVTNA